MFAIQSFQQQEKNYKIESDRKKIKNKSKI